MSILIDAQNISLSRENRSILEGVSLKVCSQDFKTIIGPNGAGKTMLLKALLGIEKLNGGTVYRKKQLRVGYVPQRLHISKDMPLRVHELISLNRLFNHEEYHSVLERFDILALLKKQVAALSGGELQRVLLARALLGHPEVLILDEPDQNFDLGAQLSLYALITSLYEKFKFAILMVSHNLHFVMSATQEVYCLNRYIHCSGSPQHVQHSSEFVRLFGKEIAENIAVFHHDVQKHEDGMHG